MRLPEWLAWRAAVTPERVAVRWRGGMLTFRELNEQADRLGRQLAGLGVQAGDRVATYVGNRIELVALVHAVSRLGAVLVPLNVRLTRGELAPLLQEVEPRLLLLEANTYQEGRAAASALSSTVILNLDDEALQELPEAGVSLRREIDLEAIHTIVFTSGTTERAKGVVLTFGNHWWNALGSQLNLGVQPEDSWLLCLPLFHVGGLSILFRSVLGGFAVVLHERFDAREANRALEEGVTLVSLVGTMLWRMLEDRGEQPYPPHVRAVLLGGGPAPEPLLQRSRALGLPVLQTYGLTETASQLATLSPEEAFRKLGSAGKPLYPNRLRIVRGNGSLALVGEIGEIEVAGPVVTPGYWRRPDLTSARLRDGWLRTGDLGFLDSEGYLFVVDRREDLIVTGGENVYPAEVEAVLLAHPAVVDAAVVGVADVEWGQRVVAVVVARSAESVSVEEIQRWCRTRLAGYKVPREILFVAELPRTASGKLQRWVVRRTLEEGRVGGQGTRGNTE